MNDESRQEGGLSHREAAQVRKIIREEITAVFLSCGVKLDDPTEMQAILQWARNSYQQDMLVKRTIWKVVLTVIGGGVVTFAGAAIWQAVKEAIRRGG